MSDDISVLCWLRKLRYNLEYYEPYDVYAFSLDDSSVMEGSDYENNWQCGNERHEKSPELDVKYAEICELSVTLICERVDPLDISPFPDCVRVGFKIPEIQEDIVPSCVTIAFKIPQIFDDVMMWKEHIRMSYCEEVQNIMEQQVSKVLITFIRWKSSFLVVCYLLILL